MTNLVLQPQWHKAINQIEKNEYMLGGADGNMNLATKQLAESILWLKQQVEGKVTEAYKVGDIYMTSIDHANAAAVKAHHGYGTWVRYAEGRAPVGFSDNASDIAEYKTMGNTFGDNTHQLTVEEMPSHTHEINQGEVNASGEIGTYTSGDDKTNIADSKITSGTKGGNQPHNNIQPSIVTGYWLRTA